MTWEIAFLILLLVVMAYLFLTAKLPVDLTAFLGLTVLILGGYVGPTEAFSGFASPAVITMLGIFVISAALLYTGIADMVASKVYTLVGGKEIPLIITLMLVSGVLSAFMNNIAATAVLMPAVAGIARRSGLSASRLMMPLAFGSILGGTTTMVGTPPNIVAATILSEQGLEPFGLFDFTPIGVLLLLAGVLFMITLGRKLLPDRQAGPGETETTDLTHIYHLEERLFTIRLPRESALDNLSLAEANLSGALGIQVVSILRQGSRNFVPKADTRLKGGDVLLVEGRLSDLEDIIRVGDVELRPTTTRQIPRPMRGFTAIRAEVREGSGLVGKSPREAQFRERYHVVIVGIERGAETLREGLGSESLEAGDWIIALGARSELYKMQSDPDFRVQSLGLAALRSLEGYMSVIRIPPGSSLVGSTVGGSRLGELVGVTIGAIIRDDVTRLAVQPDDVIEAGGGLLGACGRARGGRLGAGWGVRGGAAGSWSHGPGPASSIWSGSATYRWTPGQARWGSRPRNSASWRWPWHRAPPWSGRGCATWNSAIATVSNCWLYGGMASRSTPGWPTSCSSWGTPCWCRVPGSGSGSSVPTPTSWSSPRKVSRRGDARRPRSPSARYS